MDRPSRADRSTGTACTTLDAGSLPLKALHRALQKITETLAKELACPTATAPEWSGVDWAVARAAASIHGISPLLADTLRWVGPPDWSEFLAEQKAHTKARFSRISELLRLLDREARNQDLPLVALKGVALHAREIYAPGERPMADIDLLVRGGDSERAKQLLESLGFRQSLHSSRHTTFELADTQVPASLGEHASNSIKIELHCRIREALLLRAVEISDIIFPSRPHAGLNNYASSAALLVHLLLHAAGTLSIRELRVLHLQDIARLARRMTDADWQQLFSQAECATGGPLWWAFPALSLTARYFPGIPDWVLARSASGCHWLLRHVYRRRTISRASLSYLWITAFPGIEWASSAAEMAEYAAGRLLPSKETLRQRREVAQAQPLVSGGSWAELSQGRRLVRWLLSRQPRHATLQPVLAALARQ